MKTPKPITLGLLKPGLTVFLGLGFLVSNPVFKRWSTMGVGIFISFKLLE